MEDKRVFKSMQEVIDAFLPNHKLCYRCNMPFRSEEIVKCPRCKRLYCHYCARQHKTWLHDEDDQLLSIRRNDAN